MSSPDPGMPACRIPYRASFGKKWQPDMEPAPPAAVSRAEDRADEKLSGLGRAGDTARIRRAGDGRDVFHGPGSIRPDRRCQRIEGGDVYATVSRALRRHRESQSGSTHHQRRKRMKKVIAAALLTTALATGSALAQNATSKTAAVQDNATVHQAGSFRASKLSGVNVYNDNNDKIGDISDVILDKSGKATSVIIGVGGFLGMGEHLVAVQYDKLKWVMEPVRSTTTSSNTPTTTSRPATNVDSNARTATTDTNRTTTTGSTTTTTADNRNGNRKPNHVVF